jgi:hypothetical protein
VGAIDADDEPGYLHTGAAGHREGPARQFYGRDHFGGYRRTPLNVC